MKNNHLLVEELDVSPIPCPRSFLNDWIYLSFATRTFSRSRISESSLWVQAAIAWLKTLKSAWCRETSMPTCLSRRRQVMPVWLLPACEEVRRSQLVHTNVSTLVVAPGLSWIPWFTKESRLTCLLNIWLICWLSRNGCKKSICTTESWRLEPVSLTAEMGPFCFKLVSRFLCFRLVEAQRILLRSRLWSLDSIRRQRSSWKLLVKLTISFKTEVDDWEKHVSMYSGRETYEKIKYW